MRQSKLALVEDAEKRSFKLCLTFGDSSSIYQGLIKFKPLMYSTVKRIFHLPSTLNGGKHASFCITQPSPIIPQIPPPMVGVGREGGESDIGGEEIFAASHVVSTTPFTESDPDLKTFFGWKLAHSNRTSMAFFDFRRMNGNTNGVSFRLNLAEKHRTE
ncbi:hypothetical protein J6590_003587 [Homalodisca vitripennis]|nr:hypothetical protein J6590_003587 [Homalodisca vitripennis]